MTHRVEIRSSAQRDLAKLPVKERAKIGAKIDALATNPRPNGCTKLAGPDDLWRIRIGVYRAIYQIHDKVLVITIIHVAHRREVYRGL